MAEERKPVLEMAKALYTFKASVNKTLSFREHEYFLIYHPSTKEKNWWQVVNSKAQVGYVPSNYVMAEQVTVEYMTEFVDSCIELVRKEGPDLPVDRQELLTRLLSRRRRLDGSGSDDRSLSRTPSIISIPPTPVKVVPPVQQQQQAPPVPQHAPTSQFHASRQPESPDDCDSSSSGKSAEGGYSTLKRIGPKPPLPDRQRTPDTTSKAGGGREQPVEKKEVEPTVKVEKAVEKPPEKPVEKAISRRSSRQEVRAGISEETVYQLVEQVRCHTDLSHENSRLAVGVVLTALEKYIPDHPILAAFLGFLQGPMNMSKPLIEQTHDAQRLHVIFNELTSCKDDAQQRSWMLHEDEHVIIDYIKELTSILTDADARVCLHVVSSDQYSGVVALVEYYQMEVRWSIRQPLLTSFGVLCGLDRAVINILLSSVLPGELARDMLDNRDNVAKLNYSGLLLTMIFCMGEPMPITHYDQLGVYFLTFVLTMIENPPHSDVDDQIADLFVTMLLSYNLQFQQGVDNPLIRALAKLQVAKTFTEKILLLLNREDDPVRIFDHLPAPPHSVLKLFVDVFSNSVTAGLFYTNDVKVLIDIIVRQLADISPGDPRRHQYLWLCRVVMRNPGYGDHHHRRDDLLKCFTRIFCEETEASREDQKLVREISNEFPQYFKA